MRSPFWLALAVAAAVTAGCTDLGDSGQDAPDAQDPNGDPAPPTTPADPEETEEPQTWEAVLVIDYAAQHPEDMENVTATIVFDPESRPASPEYEATGTQRPDAYTVHDLLVQWSEAAGVAVETDHHPDWGFSLEAVDGVAAWFGDDEGWFWSLSIDGELSEMGMGLAVVEDGMEIHWTYTYTSW